jgi:outer membrane protein TolC
VTLSRRLRRALRFVAGAIVCGAVLPAAAQTVIPPTALNADASLTLDDVVRTTLRDNPNIRLAARQVDTQRGALVAAGDPFDARVQSAFGRNQFNTLQADPFAAPSPFLDTVQTQYSVALQKQFRQGILLSPELGVSKTALPSLGIQSTSLATARLNVVVPLLNDRGGFVTGAPERAAGTAYESSRFQTHHVTAQSVLMAITAYWDYQASILRLDVLTDSERRAQRLLEDTSRLVEAGERPPSDLTQVRGNAAAKRVTRLSAEQAVVDTRVQLGLLMGIGPTETAALGQATTAFPAVDAAPAASPLPVLPALPVMVAEALDRRPDLQATQRRVESARTLFDAARENLKPRVDLISSVGYAGLQIGGGSLGSLFTPIFRNVPGPDFSISFRYQWATANLGARGQLLQSEASYEQERIAAGELQRQIRTGVYQSSESIGRNAIAVTEAHAAVTLYQAMVRSEQRKFQLGVSTLFDTIQAADALTNVRLSEITAQRDYAVALATLRFQTGSLIAFGPSGATVDVDTLLSWRE